MTQDEIAQTEWEALPKVEIHVHLEGSIAAVTAVELAGRHGQAPDAALPLVDGRYPRRFRDFTEFVELYIAVSAQLRSPEDLKLVASAFSSAQRAQNVRYTEATFTAITHVRNGMPPDEMWAAVKEGLVEGGADVRLIVDTPRDNGVAAAERTIELVQDADAPIVGLGLSGVEGSVPEGDFAILRVAATEMNLGLTVHAGEVGPPERIWAALDDLGADRIGHGVSCLTDPSLVDLLKAEQIPVEVCPSSNVSLGIFESLEEHPWPEMWNAGLNVTINSDDPPFFSTTLTEDLQHAARLAELSRAEIAELQRRAARAAFAPEVERRLDDGLDAWEKG